ncbi:MAG: thioredoxin family protein [Candidatus Bathyarchaeota archaeon]|jgi:hypothetical protein
MQKKYSIKALRAAAESISDYLSRVSDKAPAFRERLSEYSLDPDVSEGLRGYAGEVSVVVFSAEWCSDCYRNVSVLGLLSDETGLEVLVFGQLMRDPKNPEELWRIPPSPPEVREFNVVKIPLIVILDKEGRKLGAVVENPPEGETLERVLLDILEQS